MNVWYMVIETGLIKLSLFCVQQSDYYSRRTPTANVADAFTTGFKIYSRVMNECLFDWKIPSIWIRHDRVKWTYLRFSTNHRTWFSFRQIFICRLRVCLRANRIRFLYACFPTFGFFYYLDSTTATTRDGLNKYFGFYDRP